DIRWFMNKTSIDALVWIVTALLNRTPQADRRGALLAGIHAASDVVLALRVIGIQEELLLGRGGDRKAAIEAGDVRELREACVAKIRTESETPGFLSQRSLVFMLETWVHASRPGEMQEWTM